jgi:hypothetical protein
MMVEVMPEELIQQPAEYDVFITNKRNGFGAQQGFFLNGDEMNKDKLVEQIAITVAKICKSPENINNLLGGNVK